MFALLAASMPRVGGDYVWVSRVLSPPLSLISNVAMIFGGLFGAAFFAKFFSVFALGPLLDWIARENRLSVAAGQPPIVLQDYSVFLPALPIPPTGIETVGAADYMFSPKVSLFVRCLSFSHLFLPYLLLWLVWRLGYDRRAVWAQTLCAWGVLILSYALVGSMDSASGNVNKIFGLSDAGPQQIMPRPLWLAVAILLWLELRPAHAARDYLCGAWLALIVMFKPNLAGVGRKTANVVLGNAFGINVGITVDTHVTRLSQRLGLTKQTDAVKIEQDLMAVVPTERWIRFSHQLIWHGRRVCFARKPDCDHCALAPMCPSFAVLRQAPARAGARA